MAQEPPGTATADAIEGGESDPPGPTFHVMILEDDVDLVDVFEGWLHRHYGETVNVHTAHTIEEAEDVLDTLFTLDFAIIDRTLPDGTGDELLDGLIVRFDPITIMITGTVPGPDLVSLPIHDYFVKPIEEDRLIKGLSLLEKLEAANSLEPYSDARKASLLEFHLEDPDSNPVFRRFAARWEYDRLEIAVHGEEAVVYELYIGEPGVAADEDHSDVHLSIAGGLETDVESMLEADLVAPEGELVPSGGGEYAWVKRDPEELIDASDGAIGIYRFTCAVPEQYITDLEESPGDLSLTDLMAVLEREYN